MRDLKGPPRNAITLGIVDGEPGSGWRYRRGPVAPAGRRRAQFCDVGRRDRDQRCLRRAIRAASRDHRQPLVADELDELRAVHDRGIAVKTVDRRR